MPARRTRYAPEPSWVDQLNAVRQYVAEHGRFPASNSLNPAHAALAAWWMTNTAAGNLANLSTNRAKAIAETYRICDERREELRQESRQRRLQAHRERNRSDARARARKQIRAAVKALDNPYLVPGDREALLLRIDNPDDNLSELAEKAGMTTSRFSAKLRGALTRTQFSSSRSGRQRPSRDAQIVAKRQAGASYAALAAEYGLSRDRIGRIVAAHRNR